MLLTQTKEHLKMQIKDVKTAAAALHKEEVLLDAARSAHGALAVSHQMMEMLREYAQLEAVHATRLQQFAHRMGDCVDRMRLSSSQQEPPPSPNNQTDDSDQDVDPDDELRARQSHCVTVMDEVVTFLTRFGSMHRHLSECINSDLFEEWNEELVTQQKRMDAQEPELATFQQQLEFGSESQVAEKDYTHAHGTFEASFAEACAAYASAAESGVLDVDEIGRGVQTQLLALPSQVRLRSSSTALQYVGSLSRRLLPSASSTSRRHKSISRDPSTANEAVADCIVDAERQRLQCRAAFQAMHRLHSRHTRLCDSLYQEYQCVQNECLASTRTSIRKLTIHLSAFTSNLQYDATQLFQHVEALHVGDATSPHLHPSPFTTLPPLSPVYPAPPSDEPLAVEHVACHSFPVMGERPRLLRHQNGRHPLAV